MIKVGQQVKIDGDAGIVQSVFPNGKHPYTGTQHAHIIVRVPKDDYTHGPLAARECHFSDIPRRISR